MPNILSHIRTVHSHDPQFLVTCGLEGCTTTFKTFSSLYSHVYRKHSDVIKKRSKRRADISQDDIDDISQEEITSSYQDCPDFSGRYSSYRYSILSKCTSL